MCGITGILRFDGIPVDYDDLDAMLGDMDHRGRDSWGIVTGSKYKEKSHQMSNYAEVGMGHRRLSIIDLSNAAIQPMSYNQEKLWISYNGEIYNYRELRHKLNSLGYLFQTHSDTEVILAAYQHWGEDCVQHFNGMYAFAIWDDDRGSLFCARDPVGIKPFYYAMNDKWFSFCSESTALTRMSGKRLNRDAVGAFLLCMYVPGPWSIYEGIRKLKPGHSLTVKADGNVSEKQFWAIRETDVLTEDRTEQEKIEILLGEAVSRQLRSDVRVGALLSGGVDSSLVVALAAKEMSGLHTFSVGYEGHDVDELPYARKVAERFGTNHHELFLSQEQSLQNLERALACCSEPIADSAVVPTLMLSQMAEAEGVKVLLSGTGGDEIFGGYNRYVSRGWRRKLLSVLPEKIRCAFGKAIGPIETTLGARLCNIGLDLVMSTGGSLAASCAIWEDSRSFSSFLSRLVENGLPAENIHMSTLRKHMLFDFSVYLPDELLFLLDQMTMACTLEGRVPLLDIEVAREAFRLNGRVHVKNGNTKILLRKILSRHLGNDFVNRHKQGFGGPVERWVNRYKSEMVSCIEPLKDICGLDQSFIDQLIQSSCNDDLSARECQAIFHVWCLAKWCDSHL